MNFVAAKTSLHRLSMIVLIISFVITLIAPYSIVHASSESVWENCPSSIQPISVIYDIGFPYWSQDHSIIENVTALQGTPVQWDSTNGAHIDERIYQVGWIYIIYADGKPLSAWVWIGNDSKDYYLMIMDTLDWFGASYNPNPQPHITCGIWRVTSADFSNLSNVIESHQQDGVINNS